MSAIPSPESQTPKLSIAGEVSRPQSLDRRELARLGPSARIADVGALVPGKKGQAARLSELAKSAGLRASARHVHIGSADPTFAVSVPITEILDTALVVFELDGGPLPREKGGPFRLLVPGHPDECVNVKQLASLTFARDPGRDTRPKDDVEHARLHARAASQHADASKRTDTSKSTATSKSTDASKRADTRHGDSSHAGTRDAGTRHADPHTDDSSRPAAQRP